MKKYTAWTRSNEKDQWVTTEIRANNIREARERLKEGGREIEKGTLRLSKNQIG
jgi:hypothetical protein